MKKQLHYVWSLGTLAVLLTFGVSLNAQQSAPSSDQAATSQTQPSDPTAQQPSTQPQSESTKTPDQSQPSPNSQEPSRQQAPDSQAQSGTSTEAQSFTGTIVKSGDKYMFQDAASGNTYDIDHQEQVKEYEGRKVKVHGTLDPSTKTIHMQ
jgi:cytoskeletal protein RodZ